MTAPSFDSLASKSRSIHGHKYVLPVAAWILEEGIEVTGVSEAMAGLAGRAERPRVIEALTKLTGMGALEEMPRDDRPSSARMFRRMESPYWSFAATEADIPHSLTARQSSSSHVN